MAIDAAVYGFEGSILHTRYYCADHARLRATEQECIARNRPRPQVAPWIFCNASGPVWLPNRLLADGARIELLQLSGDRAVLKASVLPR